METNGFLPWKYFPLRKPLPASVGVAFGRKFPSFLVRIRAQETGNLEVTQETKVETSKKPLSHVVTPIAAFAFFNNLDA